MTYKIETGVPMPLPANHTGTSEALRALADAPIGASVMFDGAKKTSFNATKQRVQKECGVNFTMRTVEGGIRVWRIA